MVNTNNIKIIRNIIFSHENLQEFFINFFNDLESSLNFMFEFICILKNIQQQV